MTYRIRGVVHLALLIVLGTVMIEPADAQDGRSLDPSKMMSQYVLESWSEDDGLPQTSVSSIVSTPDGYLWLGTQEGLVRYNGIEFRVFDKGNTAVFSEDHMVESMLVDSKGRLWIGLGQGLILYENLEFTNVRLNSGLTVKTVRAITEDEDGKIWIATATDGIYVVEDSMLVRDEFISGVQDGIVTSFLTDPEGGFWIGTDDALFRVLNRQVKQFSDEDGIPRRGSDLVNILFRDRQGNVWVGASGGAVFVDRNERITPPDFDLKGAAIGEFFEDAAGTLWMGSAVHGLLRVTASGLNEFTADGTLSGQAISSLHVDEEGSLWIGTDGAGLSRLRAGKFTTYTKHEGIASNVVYTVFEDRNEHLWIGTDGGGVTVMINGETTTYSTNNGLSGNVISGLAQQADGSVWVGTYGNGLNRIHNGLIEHFRTGDGLPNDEVTALYVDSSDRLWVGTNSGVAVFDNGTFTTTSKADGLVDDLVTVIKEDNQGAVWVGTYASGLSKIGQNGIENVTVAEGLPNDRVFSFLMDDDVIWIGTYGGGIARYKDGEFATISMRDGLFNDYIYNIVESDDGMLWMTCNKGIFRISKEMLNQKADGAIERVRSEIYNREDGLKGNEMNGGFQPAGWKGADGRLWFPSMRGVAMINPTDIRRNESPPRVHIESFIVDGKPYTPGSENTFSSRIEKIEIHFAALSYEAPRRNRYEHRLVGYQDDWEPSTGRTATYTNLDPGTYVFQVRASNNDDLWSTDGESISFRLQPQYFETTWFLLLCISLAVAIAVVTYRYRISRLNNRQAELEKERDKARAADRFKSVILDNLNHEFRTPLTVILGCTDILLSELPESEIDFAADIKSHGMRLLHTLDSLFELARIQRDESELDSDIVDIPELVTDLIAMHRSGALERRIDLSLEVGSAVMPVQLERRSVLYALTAVVENALKFTDHGSVCVKIMTEEDWVVVRVADTGMGISRSDFDIIFEPFRQASEGLDRKYEGAGIGLTIARQLVEAIGGTLVLESSGVDGSTFALRFPAMTTDRNGRKHHRSVDERHGDRLERGPVIRASRLGTRLQSDVNRDPIERNGRNRQPF